MTDIYRLIDVIVAFFTLLVVFFKVNDIAFSPRNFLIALLLRFPIGLPKILLTNLFGFEYLSYLDTPLYGLLLSFVFLRPLPKTLRIFYGLFPMTLWDLFHRCSSYFILSLFGESSQLLENVFISIINLIVVSVSVFIFLRWLGYDFGRLRTQLLDLEDKRLLYILNWLMLLYFFILETLTYLEYEHQIMSLPYRKLIVVFYLILFMGFIKQLDSHLKTRLQEKLALQQEQQLLDMENYSQQIEGLYRDIRGFRHDYANLLTTLSLGIEAEDMEQVKAVYESVLKRSDKGFRSKKFDLGRLIHIENSALKSLLAAKFLEASDKGIETNLEVPEPIQPQGMDLVDFIVIVSILCDNAIEAALAAEHPNLRLAFLTVGSKQLFIVENTTREEVVDTTALYDFGVSSKGQGRGIGLYNAMKIIERYPHASLNTTSQDHHFYQVLEIAVDI